MNVNLVENSSLNDSFIDAPIAAISHPLHPLQGVNTMLGRQNVKFLSLNIFLRPPFIKNNESDHKDERLKEFIKVLEDFDIICLQEMFGFLNKRKHKLIRCATKAGFLYYADSPSPSFLTSYVVDGGLLLLSRFPILASEFKPYPYGIFSDSLAQKGVLYNKIQIRDEMLHIYSTHTQASYFGETQRYPIITRADQFAACRAFIVSSLKKNGYRDGEVVLIAGDLNVDAKKPFIETSKIKHYPGFKDYPHLGRNEYFNEYDAMLCYFSDNFNDEIEDLLYKRYGEHPITYAETAIDEATGQPRAMETVLTHKDDLCSNQSLDYMFRLYPKSFFKSKTQDLEGGKSSRPMGKLSIVENSATVEKLFVPSREFTQMSDHYGSSVTLEYSGLSREGELGVISSSAKPSFDQYQTHYTEDKFINLD